MAAFISIIGNPQIEGGDNRFSVDGCTSKRIWGGPNLYKLKTGKHTVVITSANGEQWSVEADLSWDKLLTIKPQMSGSAISGVQYKIEDMPPMMGWAASKL